ncbi:hypothetical protein WOLCODRAFT_164449 [Wolfiporia cocos MD-104 SS10]|uniref:F-box domain-containing protein n=1 Tax=Wolfiporia cocos (strain MD-104) TaxID=742152 RepID=A0A2H3JMN6_WOLCO|nr:hypothetical protein WOLCODRAFT_164449 [Wolfiporia cocos MD-104 SS10]
MNILSLNDDALADITSFLSTRDALELSATVRRLHPIAKQHALSVILLDSPQKMRRVCAYLLEDIPGRLTWLRHLRVTIHAFGIEAEYDVERGDYSTATLLANTLERAEGLQHFSLACAEKVLPAEPRIGQALASLPNLQTLELQQTAEGALRVASRQPARLRALVMRQLEYLFTTPQVFTELAPLQNLKSLELWHIDERNTGAVSGPILPALRHLSAIKVCAPMFMFVRAFPNIRALTMRNVCVSPHSTFWQNEPTDCWPRLDELAARPEDFAHWHVACRVQRLRFDSCIQRDADKAATLAHTAVQNTGPAVLQLEASTWAVGRFWSGLARNASRLRFVDLILSDGRSMTNLAVWIANVPQLLGQIELTCLRIRINDLCKRVAPELDSGVPVVTEEAILRDLPTRLATAVPSLRYLALGIGNVVRGEDGVFQAFDGAVSWWIVEFQGTDRRLKPISADIGEDAIMNGVPLWRGTGGAGGMSNR